MHGTRANTTCVPVASGFDVFHPVGGFHLKGDMLAGQCVDKDLHGGCGGRKAGKHQMRCSAFKAYPDQPTAPVGIMQCLNFQYAERFEKRGQLTVTKIAHVEIGIPFIEPVADL